jgi:hypothetical protein
MGEAAIPLVNLSERLALARSLVDVARCSSKVFSQLCGRATERSNWPYFERNQAYGAKVERGFVIDIEAFDWDCPQHITPRFTLTELAPSIEGLKSRIAELEVGLTRVKSG